MLLIQVGTARQCRARVCIRKGLQSPVLSPSLTPRHGLCVCEHTGQVRGEGKELERPVIQTMNGFFLNLLLTALQSYEQDTSSLKASVPSSVKWKC